MGHDAEFVQRRLPVEQNHVSVYQMPFHQVSILFQRSGEWEWKYNHMVPAHTFSSLATFGRSAYLRNLRRGGQ